MLGVLVGSFVLWSVIRDLPDVASLKEYKHSHATEVFSADGEKIAEFRKRRRYPVAFEEIPKHVINAFLAAEDSNFYEHHGVDPYGIARAVITNLLKGRYAQGASTITQQVARVIILNSRKKHLTRKIREMVLAWRMEEELTKNEILALYLNEIYLGHGSFGIAAAARTYFDKDVGELGLAEGSLLAGLPQRPNDWNPFHNPHLAKRRQQYVLNRMVDEGFINKEQSLEALSKPLRLYALEEFNDKKAPYFTEHIRQYLMDKYGSEPILTSGFKVYTNLNYRFQQAAQKAVKEGLRDVDKRLGWRGVKKKLETPEEVDEFAQNVHKEVMRGITQTRILPPVFEKDESGLAFELTLFEEEGSPYYGPTPVKVGEYHQAVVTEIDMAIPEEATGKEKKPNNLVYARVGQSNVVLPFDGFKWVKLGEEKDQEVERADQFLAVGDVIDVRIDKIEREQNLITVSLEQEPEVQGALLSFEVENGFVRAMVGGRDFLKSKFNTALQAKRQVGSTFKPVVYASALDKGLSPSSMVTDSPIVFKFEGELDADNVGEDWRPKNYGGNFKGEIPLRLALIRSMNIPTIKVLDQVSVDWTIRYARRLGITAPLPRDLSIGLGSWSSSLDEVLQAYAVFPRLGRPVELHFINRVVDANGNILEEYTGNEPVVRDTEPDPFEVAKAPEGEAEQALDPNAPPVEEAPPKTKPVPEVFANLPEGQVIDSGTAYVMTDLLKAVVQEGTGWRAKVIPGEVAGKTGTSNDHRDAWFVGYTPQLMAGVWVGYLQDKPLESKETGGRAAAPIWVSYMKSVVGDYPQRPFAIPDGVVFAYVDRETGELSRSANPNRVRVAFKPQMVPTRGVENLPRVGEPGARARLNANTIPIEDPNDPDSGFAPPEPEDETSDYLRQGYQE